MGRRQVTREAAIEFHPSELTSVGMELEYQLLDAETLEQTEGIESVIEVFEETERIQPELIQNSVELVSRPCPSFEHLEGELKGLLKRLIATCEELGIAVCGSGTHPFSRRWASVTERERFRKLESTAAYMTHTQILFAQHVHLGMSTRREMLDATRRLRTYLPMLVALSANSPFWRGHRTSFGSFRQRVGAMTRSYCPPPSFQDWWEFQDFVDSARHGQMMETMKDIHWQVRPRPELGTVEVRVMDTPSTLEEALQVAAFLQVLAMQLKDGWPEDDRLPREIPDWMLQENLFRAAHDCMEAKSMIGRRGHQSSLRRQFLAVMETLEPLIEELGHGERLGRLRERVVDKEARQPGYLRQLKVFEETDSLRRVTEVLVEQLRD